MAVKLGGKSATRSTVKKDKPAAKGTTRKAGASKPTTRTNARGTKVTSTKNSAKATPAKKAAPKTSSNGNGSHLSEAQKRKVLAQAKKIGDRRKRLEAEYKEAVAETLLFAEDHKGELPMTQLAGKDGLNISRTWIYKNRNHARSAPSAKATTKAKPAAKSGTKARPKIKRR